MAPDPLGGSVAISSIDPDEAMSALAARIEDRIRGLDVLALRREFGHPADVLLRAGADAGCLVLGTRSHGAIMSALLGSVSRECVDHTSVPVIVVPHDTEIDGAQMHITVGVDGSDNSTAALRWAAQFADHASITAIAAWSPPIGFGYDLPPFDPNQLRRDARQIVDDTADTVTKELGLDADAIAREVEGGDPRRVLHDAQANSDLLVVGARGRSGITHLMLGSTTTALIHRPHCPIAVVPS
jgi:nucleotide-binding universal stress UspA family protein